MANSRRGAAMSDLKKALDAQLQQLSGGSPEDWQRRYRGLGRLIQVMPNLDSATLSDEAYQWLGRAYALVNEVDTVAGMEFKLAADRLGTMLASTQPIRALLYRALALCERHVPADVGGAFIPVGNAFDAFAAISKVLKTATNDVFIVDAYMDEAVLTEFGLAVPGGIPLRLLADEATHKPQLRPAAEKWSAQYGATRPLAVRLAPPRSLHDRAIFIDSKVAWTVTQSFNGIAKRSAAEIIRADDVAPLKIPAYEQIWSSSTVLL